MNKRTYLCALGLALTASAATQGFVPPGAVPSFLKAVRYPVPGAVMVAVVDVNHDGSPDLVTANGAAGGVSLLLGNGDGTFQAPRSIGAGNPTSIVTGDFNGDGNQDLAVANLTFNSGQTLVSVYLGNGDGTFRQAPDIAVGGLSVSNLTTADFNNDGKTDLAISTLTAVTGISQVQTYNLAIMLGRADGAFDLGSSVPSGTGSGTLAADFNGDGKPDLFVLGSSLIKLGKGDGTFVDGQVIPASSYQAVALDGNGDGKMDLTILTGGRTRSGPIVYTFTGNGDGTFVFGGTASPVFGTYPVSQFVAADFNGDGRPDFVTAWGATDNQNGGPAPWGGPIDWGLNMFIANKWFAVGDFDRNGSQDLALVDGTAVYIARNSMGNPPLLGLIALDSSFVVGGTSTINGTVKLGGPAPAGGSVVALASNNPAAAFLLSTSVTIPAGATSATFTVTTGVVAAATPVNISATLGSVTQTGSITVVPPISVSSITIAPASLFGFFGGNFAQGTVTLSGPASDSVVVALTSSNTAGATVQASVSVLPGATTATFSLSALHVSVNTPVTITGSYQGTTASGIVNVLRGNDTVTITKTEYVVSKSQFKMEATSSDASAAFMRVFNAITGAPIGSLVPAGGGKFTGQFFVPGPFTSVAVQSANGGLTIGAVIQR